MEHYNTAYALEKENNPEARYYYELAILFEYHLAFKHMEYLDKPNILKYLTKYTNRKVNSDFIEILSFWYKNSKIYMNTRHLYSEISCSDLDDIWINIWFAKGDSQKSIDEELKRFEYYYNKYKDYEPTYLYEYIALIILYDQIPRNIFRNSAKAYETDGIAFKHAEYLMKYINFMPMHLCIPIIMSYVHCESLDILKKTKDIIHDIGKKYYNHNIFPSLNAIFQNHYDRITLFGRIPERNKFLNRISTESELVYLQNL